jgi:Xaa-Pro aminopeptidase
MQSNERIPRFQALLADQPTLVYLPLSADLQYLSGIQREMPNYGATLHPGGWVEGLWMTSQHDPILALTRMTAEFSHPGSGEVEVRILGEWASPAQLLEGILTDLNASEAQRMALGEGTAIETVTHLKAHLPQAEIISASERLRPLRAIKSAEEIAAMRRAGQITEAAFADVVQHLRHGMTELEVIREVDYQLRRHGSLGSSFQTALYAVGPEHELIFGEPQRAGPRPLNPPVALLFDFGAIYEGYCYDFGRTVSFGTPAPDLQQAFELVMAAQKAGIAAMRAGAVKASEVDRAARQVIEAAGKGETFRHRLGHGIGLDVHEPPFLTQGDETRLKAGMLFTVEPSVLTPYGGSARVEDVVMVDENGGVPLTSGFQDLIVIE